MSKKTILIGMFFLITGVVLGNKIDVEAFAFSYGKTIAVINEDITQEYDDQKLNFAFYAINILEDVNKYNFDIVSKEKAKEGLENDYYIASLEFPSDFSKNILTVNESNPVKAQINYDINKNLSPEYQTEIIKDIQYYFYIINNCINYMYTYGIFEGIHKSQSYIEDIQTNNEKSIEYFQDLLELKLLDGYDFSYDDLNMVGVGEEIKNNKEVIMAYIEENQLAYENYLEQLAIKENAISIIGENGYLYFENSFGESKENIVNRMRELNDKVEDLDTSMEYDDLYSIINKQFTDLFTFNNNLNNLNIEGLGTIDDKIKDIVLNPGNTFGNDIIISRIDFERDLYIYSYCSRYPQNPTCGSNLSVIKDNAKNSLENYNNVLNTTVQEHINKVNDLYNNINRPIPENDILDYINNNFFPHIISYLKSLQDLGPITLPPVITEHFESKEDLDKICQAYYSECVKDDVDHPDKITSVGNPKFSIDDENHYLMYDDGSGELKRVVSTEDEDILDGVYITMDEIFDGVCSISEDNSTLIDNNCGILSEVIRKHNEYGKENTNLGILLKWMFDPNYQESEVEEGELDLSFVNKEDLESEAGRTTPTSIYADIFGYYYCEDGENYSYAKKSGDKYTCDQGEATEVKGVTTIFEDIPIFQTALSYIFNVDPEQKEIDKEKYYAAQEQINNSVDEKISNNKEALANREEEISEDIDEVKSDENYQNEVNEKIDEENRNNTDSKSKLSKLANLMLNSLDGDINNTKVYDFIANPVKIKYEDTEQETSTDQSKMILMGILLLIIVIILSIIIKIFRNKKKV